MASNKYNLDIQKARDQNIMRYLAAGPADWRTLYDMFFRNENGNLLSRSIAERRLSKLVAQGRIYRLTYYSDHGQLVKYYVLTELGATQISQTCLIPRESIRVI